LQVLIEEKTVTDDGPYGADTIYLVVNVSANGTTMTMVLCPREKNSPQVTGSCPEPIKDLVALSMALHQRQSA